MFQLKLAKHLAAALVSVANTACLYVIHHLTKNLMPNRIFDSGKSSSIGIKVRNIVRTPFLYKWGD